MDCEKDGYSKRQAEAVRKRIYTEQNTHHKKLKIYLCPLCKKYHLTSSTERDMKLRPNKPKKLWQEEDQQITHKN